MTDRPYTDDDLRAEAARQHALSVEDPDFMGIGERMEYTFIDSTVVDPDPATGTEPITGTTWDKLPREDFDAAQRSIDDLLTKAADLSEWAINLGADGLEPDGHTIQLGIDLGDGDRPQVRMHFAFHPDMTADQRAGFVMDLTKVVQRNL
ncbi:hypothetical protein ACIQSP_16645 [Streptomyces nigra]|uniref:hypothetical protein n=1 Tax=Streptomyces nigra TaxID=1827580 RepID=UPI003830F4FE